MNDINIVRDIALAASEATRQAIQVGKEAARREYEPRVKALTDALEEALDFLERYEDVEDGDYGEPRPNAFMSAANAIRYALGRRPGP